MNEKNERNLQLLKEYLSVNKTVSEKLYKKTTLKSLQQLADTLGINSTENKRNKRELWNELRNVLVNLQSSQKTKEKSKKQYGSEIVNIDDIILSISKVYTSRSGRDFEYNGGHFPIIEEHGFKFVIIPKGYKIYKTIDVDVSFHEFITGECDNSKRKQIPSFFGNKDLAEYYNKLIYTGKGFVKEYEIIRPVKLLLLNDLANILGLAVLFRSHPKVKGFIRNAVSELFLVTGLGTHCKVQDKFKKQVEDKLGYQYVNYDLNKSFCELYKDEKLKRLSLYAIDLQFSKNLCKVMSKYGSDGYIGSEMPTVFSDIPLFHPEIMICLTCDNFPFATS